MGRSRHYKRILRPERQVHICGFYNSFWVRCGVKCGRARFHFLMTLSFLIAEIVLTVRFWYSKFGQIILCFSGSTLVNVEHKIGTTFLIREKPQYILTIFVENNFKPRIFWLLFIFRLLRTFCKSFLHTKFCWLKNQTAIITSWV